MAAAIAAALAIGAAPDLRVGAPAADHARVLALRAIDNPGLGPEPRG